MHGQIPRKTNTLNVGETEAAQTPKVYLSMTFCKHFDKHFNQFLLLLPD